MIEPAIVVIAYNRVEPLKRLLQSLDNGQYPSNKITLHISIDASMNSEVEELARQYEWAHGEKIVDVKAENLGLLKHVLECGELTEKYDSIIVLEDDLIVAPGFYQYALSANDFYSKDEKIAGVSLFTYPVEENNFHPFEPIRDDSDVHFIQVASSWGQSWSKVQWSKFKSWLTEFQNEKKAILPSYVLDWGDNSWKKLFINYLIATDRYFVFPNTAYSSNFEEEGTHASDTGLFQVPLNIGESKLRFRPFGESNSVYDVYFELKSECLKSLNSNFDGYDFSVDIYGEKQLDSIDSEFILTSRRGKNAIKSYAAKMKPLLQNVLFNIEGDDLGLYRKEDLLPSEKNRFLGLYSGSIRLDQHSKTRKQKIERVTFIVPVLDDQLKDLSETFGALKSDRFYNLILQIVCSSSLENQVRELARVAPVEIEITISDTQNLDEFLRLGMHSSITDYCTWIQPGMIIDPKRGEDVARVFQGISQVQILRGLDKEVSEHNYDKLNTSSYLWTPKLANLKKEEAVKFRSEFVFWRRSLFSAEDISKLSTANLFLELLKANPVYVLALKLGEMNERNSAAMLTSSQVKESLQASEFQPKGGFRIITRPVFRYWFRRNVPFFRLFYRETEHLPLVIRYDFKHDSYFLANY